MVETNIFKLNIENEFRMFVGENSDSVGVQLVEGLAEMFGTELVKNKIYMFPAASSIAVFTWHGCTLKVIGRPMQAYVATETPMILYVTLHAMLEEMRAKADAENRRGPVALFVGPTDTGKSTLCRLMLNYTVRLGRRPLLIDLDVGQNALSIPGTVNVLNVSKPADIVDGFDQDEIQAYQFGYKSPGQLIALYFLLIKKIGDVYHSRVKHTNRNSRSSGAIINTCGWTRGNGYSAITLAAMAFEIDVLVVLEEDRLYHQLKRDMPQSVKVIYIPRMGGVIDRSRAIRVQSREKRVREYFYGSSLPLYPHTFTVKFQAIKILQVKMGNSGGREVGIDVTLDSLDVTEVPIGPHLRNKVLALSAADSMKEDVILTNVLGFISIIDIDISSQVLKILSPQPGPLPRNILIMGEIELTERGITC